MEWLAVGLLLILGAWNAIYFIRETGLLLEDALITFRYAENLATGNGLVYNIGEKVLGTTTPLMSVILAFLGRIFGVAHIPLLAHIVGVSSGLAAGLFLYLSLRVLRVAMPAALLAMLVFFFHPDIVWMVNGGMETSLVFFFMAAGLYGAVSGRVSLAGVASGLLMLTRIDGVFWAGCLLLVFLLRRDRPLRYFLIASAIVIPWLIFASVYYGSPVPHSVVAKRSIGIMMENPLLHANHIRESLFAFYKAFTQRGLTAAWLVLVVIGAVDLLWERRWMATLVFLAFPVLFAVALLFGGGLTYIFPWYLGPVVFCSIGLMIYGVTAVSRILLHYNVWMAVVIVAALLSGIGLATATSRERSMQWHAMLQVNEEGLRKAVGEWIDHNTAADASVAMEAIGYQGFYARRRTIDLAGIISPQMVQLRQMSSSNAEAFYSLLTIVKPDYVVLRSFEVDRNVHFHGGPLFATQQHKDYFMNNYREAKRFSAPYVRLFGPRAFLTVYARR